MGLFTEWDENPAVVAMRSRLAQLDARTTEDYIVGKLMRLDVNERAFFDEDIEDIQAVATCTPALSRYAFDYGKVDIGELGVWCAKRTS
jgi:hypothetical protein